MLISQNRSVTKKLQIISNGVLVPLVSIRTLLLIYRFFNEDSICNISALFQITYNSVMKNSQDKEWNGNEFLKRQTGEKEIEERELNEKELNDKEVLEGESNEKGRKEKELK